MELSAIVQVQNMTELLSDTFFLSSNKYQSTEYFVKRCSSRKRIRNPIMSQGVKGFSPKPVEEVLLLAALQASTLVSTELSGGSSLGFGVWG